MPEHRPATSIAQDEVMMDLDGRPGYIRHVQLLTPVWARYAAAQYDRSSASRRYLTSRTSISCNSSGDSIAS